MGKRMEYIMDPTSISNVKLCSGRVCEAGNCSENCSRVLFPTFMTPSETDLDKFPGLEEFTFNDLSDCSAGTILGFVRLLERVRRAIADEYDLQLSEVLPVQGYSRRY